VRQLNLRKQVSSLLVSILVGYLLVLAFIRIFESHLIFFPNYPSRTGGDWNPHGLAAQDVWLTSEDGTRLHAWWIPDESAEVTFVAFHGNAGNVADRAPVYEFLRDTPANVFALEYRGYGRSEGKSSEQGFYQDADAAFAYLVNIRGKDPATIFAFGQSLGTAVATHLAARHQVGGVVLEAPFLSASRVARRIFWFLPGTALLVRSQFDTEQRLKEIKAPIFIVHCNQDPVLSVQFGREVYDRAQPPKYFLEISGYCHEEASVIAPTKYQAALREFLIKTGQKRASGTRLP
jgi:fermentation-respiration switch protein FrsA (DUF1100 family)